MSYVEPSDRPARRRGSSCRRRRRSGELVVRRRRDRDPRRVEHRSGLAHARAVDVGVPERVVLPDDEVVRAVEGDARGELVVRRRRDRDPGRVEHRAGRAHAGAVDVDAGTAVLPDDEVVRAVEGDARVVLAVRPPSRSRSPPGRGRRRPGSPARRRRRRIRRSGSPARRRGSSCRRTRPRVLLVARSRRDRDPGRIEHRAGLLTRAP